MTEETAKSELCPVFIKLPSEHIVTLKFILESYEGLGILRTLNPGAGEVVILALSETVNAVQEIIKTLAPELDLRVIPPPASVKNDWLMAEERIE